ncbi:hypothetical protein GGR56DRAFT_624264 [Xylariaceae sp. FL0804]|nr:hypothetical protein GGR56DRAFT_624264 [Xylariaceae sp. FL0804]
MLCHGPDETEDAIRRLRVTEKTVVNVDYKVNVEYEVKQEEPDEEDPDEAQSKSGSNNRPVARRHGPGYDDQGRQRYEITAEAEQAQREQTGRQQAAVAAGGRRALRGGASSHSGGEVVPQVPTGGLTIYPRGAIRQIRRGGHVRALVNRRDPQDSLNIVQSGRGWNTSQTVGPAMMRQATEVAIDSLGVTQNTVVVSNHAVVQLHLSRRARLARLEDIRAVREALSARADTSSRRGGSGGGRGSPRGGRGGGRGDRGGGGRGGGRRRHRHRHHPYDREGVTETPATAEQLDQELDDETNEISDWLLHGIRR